MGDGIHMNNKLYLTILLLVLFTSTAFAISDTNLVAYYKFDESNNTVLIDYVGFDHNLTQTSGVSSSVAGKINTAFDYDGSNGMSVTSTGLFTSSQNQVSISMWVKPDIAQNNYLFSFKRNPITGLNIFAGYVRIDGKVSFTVSSGSGHETVNSSNAITIGSWNHVVFVWKDNARWDVYVNNVKTSGVIHSKANPLTEVFNFGSAFNNDIYESYFNGKIDETGIFNTVLSDSEVSDLYNSGFALAYPFTSSPTADNGWLPNGEAPFCTNWDGHITSNYTFTVADQTDLNRVKEAGFNCIHVDARANFIINGITGNIANDFNFVTLDALVTYAGSIGLYVGFQPVYDGSAIPSFIDNNASYASMQTINVFPTTTPTFTTQDDYLSYWDNDTNYFRYYWLYNFANHWVDNNTMVMLITPPNELNSLYGLMDFAPTADLNLYWQGTYLPNKYGSLAALNTAWGTSWTGTAFEKIPAAYNFSNIFHAQDFWEAKSNKVIEVLSENSRYLSLPDSNKLILSAKLHADFLYSTGDTNYYNYLHSLDINKFAAASSPYITFLAYNPYPDYSNIRLQSSTMDIRSGIVKSIADDYNIPVFCAECFPTVNAGDAETDVHYVAQLLLQSLAYVGNSRDSGVRGISVFAWETSLGPTLSIKGTASETMIKYISPYIKLILATKNQDYNNPLYIYDNTNLNQIYNRLYYRYEQLRGFTNEMHKVSDLPLQFKLNGATPDTNKVMFVNPIVDYNANINSVASWVNSGGTLISAFRAFGDTEKTFSEYGTAANRGANVRLLFGQSISGINNNVQFDANVVATKSILSSLNVGDKIFQCNLTGGDKCDYEAGALTTGTTEAMYSGNTYPMLIKNDYGLGTSIHYAYNLNDLISANDANVNSQKALSDIFTYSGIPQRTTAMQNIYAWNGSSIAVFNAFDTATYTFNFDANTPYTLIFVDGNIVTIQDTSSTSIELDMNSGQSILLLKGSDLTPPITTISTFQTPDSFDTNVTLTCLDDYSGCETINYNIDSNGWNTQTVSGNTSYTFLYPGIGNHTIQYYSTDKQGNSETIHDANFLFTQSTTTTTTMSYTIPDNNNQATITLTCAETTYACTNSYYYIDSNTTPNLYTAPFIYTGTGQHTITYYSFNTNSQPNAPTTSNLNMPVLLTILYPKNVQTLVQLTEKWNLLSNGGVTVNLTDLNTDKNVYVAPNILTTFYIVDVNGNYTQSTFTRTYYADSNNGTTDTLQPYLYAIATSLATTINVLNKNSSAPIPGITIKFYGNLPGIGNTLIGQGTTDSKGQILQLFTAGQTYMFDVYRGSTPLGQYTYLAVSNTTTLYFNFLEFDVNTIPPTTITGTSDLNTSNFFTFRNMLFSSCNNEDACFPSALIAIVLTIIVLIAATSATSVGGAFIGIKGLSIISFCCFTIFFGIGFLPLFIYAFLGTITLLMAVVVQ